MEKIVNYPDSAKERVQHFTLLMEIRTVKSFLEICWTSVEIHYSYSSNSHDSLCSSLYFCGYLKQHLTFWSRNFTFKF